MLGFLLDAAVFAVELLVHAGRRVSIVGAEMPHQERNELARRWRQWADDAGGFGYEPGTEHLFGRLEGFDVDIKRAFAEMLPLRIVVHAHGFTGVDTPIVVARGKYAGSAEGDARRALDRLLVDVATLEDLHVEPGAVTFRLVPHAAPGDVETVLGRIGELARVGVDERGYR
jgi:hypothetical protein